MVHNLSPIISDMLPVIHCVFVVAPICYLIRSRPPAEGPPCRLGGARRGAWGARAVRATAVGPGAARQGAWGASRTMRATAAAVGPGGGGDGVWDGQRAINVKLLKYRERNSKCEKT